MATLPETASFDSGIYKIETTDPVVGGPETAISNKQAAGLANRTAYLKEHVDELETDVAALQTAVSTPMTTQAAGDDDQSGATTAFVHRAQGGNVVVDAAGTGNLTLTSDQWGVGVIILTGILTGNRNVIVPTRNDLWLIDNRTTGDFTITVKTAAGTGVTVQQARSKSVFCDGTNVKSTETDLSTRGRKITSATTLAAGDEVYVDFTGGTFAVTLPASPQEGDTVIIRGHFAVSNLTVNRNGKSIADKDGVAQAANLILNRNNVRAVIGYYNGYWQA